MLGKSLDTDLRNFVENFHPVGVGIGKVVSLVNKATGRRADLTGNLDSSLQVFAIWARTSEHFAHVRVEEKDSDLYLEIDGQLRPIRRIGENIQDIAAMYFRRDKTERAGSYTYVFFYLP